MGSFFEFFWEIRSILLSTTVTFMCGHCIAIILNVGPSTNPAPIQHIFVTAIVPLAAKRKAVENNCETPRKIIKHTLDENSLDGNNSSIQVRDINYAKINLYNAWRKIMPKIPESSFDIHKTFF